MPCTGVCLCRATRQGVVEGRTAPVAHVQRQPALLHGQGCCCKRQGKTSPAPKPSRAEPADGCADRPPRPPNNTPPRLLCRVLCLAPPLWSRCPRRPPPPSAAFSTPLHPCRHLSPRPARARAPASPPSSPAAGTHVRVGLGVPVPGPAGPVGRFPGPELQAAGRQRCGPGRWRVGGRRCRTHSAGRRGDGVSLDALGGWRAWRLLCCCGRVMGGCRCSVWSRCGSRCCRLSLQRPAVWSPRPGPCAPAHAMTTSPCDDASCAHAMVVSGSLSPCQCCLPLPGPGLSKVRRTCSGAMQFEGEDRGRQ